MTTICSKRVVYICVDVIVLHNRKLVVGGKPKSGVLCDVRASTRSAYDVPSDDMLPRRLHDLVRNLAIGPGSIIIWLSTVTFLDCNRVKTTHGRRRSYTIAPTRCRNRSKSITRLNCNSRAARLGCDPLMNKIAGDGTSDTGRHRVWCRKRPVANSGCCITYVRCRMRYGKRSTLTDVPKPSDLQGDGIWRSGLAYMHTAER